MANLTNKNLDFLSNEELINVLQSVLNELDVVISAGAHRSATYLAVSAIEGLLGELIRLLRISPSTIAGHWPQYRGKDKGFDHLTLEDKINIFKYSGALPVSFDENLYHTVREYRNYMHPMVELKDLRPIRQSVGQLALGCLNALIEKYESMRFVASQRWQLVGGLAQVPANNVIHMPQKPGEFISLLVSEQSAKDFRGMKFRVIIPPGAIFNFIYSYFSLNEFMGARIEGREGYKGLAGKLKCTKWEAWTIDDQYTASSEPDPLLQEHNVEINLDSPEDFSIAVDGKYLELKRTDWDFRPEGKIGFITEWGGVSILDLEIQTR